MIHATLEERTPWAPKSEEEKDQVRRQMHRLLETAHFKNSRRYPALFQFIVEETLEGRGEFLKERLLGVRVFHRPPDYDTASDPIVRVTIAEIRKRIAQYYHEEEHATEMRIELMPGHYEPEFRPYRGPSFGLEESARTEAVAELAAAAAAAAEDSRRSERKFRLAVLSRGGASAAVLALLALFSIGLWRFAHPSAIEELWGPVLNSRRTITFCIPSGESRRSSQIAAAAGIVSARPTFPQHGGPVAGLGTFLEHENEGENVAFSDALATVKISDWIASHGHESRLRADNSTTLYDLQQGPTILIGGLDNEWTLRAIGRLRYRFAGTDLEQYWIIDNDDPGRRDWVLDLRSRYSAVTSDFALIARLHDRSTGQIQVIVAGIGTSGTAAAGEFLVDPDQLEELRRRVGPGFRNRDFEAVLGTDVVNGIPGSAKILAVAVW
jgi:hypothetical protein